MAIREDVLLVPQISVSISDSELGITLLSAVQKMGCDSATDDQTKEVKVFALGKDVFVSLPTGSRKSLCYACSSFEKHSFLQTKSVCPSLGPENTNPGFTNQTKNSRIPWLPDSVE